MTTFIAVPLVLLSITNLASCVLAWRRWRAAGRLIARVEVQAAILDRYCDEREKLFALLDEDASSDEILAMLVDHQRGLQ